MNTPIYIKLDGIDTREYGIYAVDPLPPVIAPARRIVKAVTVLGRSGSLTYSDGAYDEYERTATLYFDGLDPQLAIDALSNPHTVTFSNEPDKVYLCRRSSAISLDRLRRKRFKFSYGLTVNPLKRQINPEAYNVGSGLTLINPGNEIAYPSFDVLGTGTLVLSVGGEMVTVTGVSSGLTIEGADIFKAYDANGSADNRMTGEFPSIAPGASAAVTFSGVASVSVRPNWRWH